MRFAISNLALKSTLLAAFLVTGCTGGFKAELTELTPKKLEVAQVDKVCSSEFIKLYADVATEVNGKNYSTEISKDKTSLENIVKACDSLMLAAPYGACELKLNASSTVINDLDFENVCLDAGQDLKALNEAAAPVETETPIEPQVKICSDSFVTLYENVNKLVSGKDYNSQIKKDATALKDIVKACDELLLLAPYGECKVSSESNAATISDFDFENLCLDADADLKIASVVQPAPVITSQPQATALPTNDLLKSTVNFELKTTNPPAMSLLINSQKIRDHYILYFIGGTRLTQSPTTDQIGIGCSVYADEETTAADFAKPITLERKSLKPVLAGMIILFEMNANQKKFKIQCFKKVTEKNPTFTLSDIQKHLGTYFKVVQKQSLM